MNIKVRPAIVVGIHIGHDRSVSIVKDGKLIGHIAEERLDRVKHSPSVEFPKKSLLALIDHLNISLEDINLFVVTYAFVQIDRVIENLAEEFRLEFNLKNATVVGLSHHLAHAYSTFYTSPFEDALILICDGAGDLTSEGKLEAESAYRLVNDKIECFWKRTQDIPSSYSDRRNFYHPDYIPKQDWNKQISFARKYEQLTYMIGFKWGQSGKTMGLASFGNSLVTVDRWSNNLNLTEPDVRFKDLIYQLEEIRLNEGLYHHEFVKTYKQDIAATAQSEVEKLVINLLNRLYIENKSTNLCLAGGLFLNCVINHKILQKTPFKQIHICPAAGDDGQSIGAAYYGYYEIFSGSPAKVSAKFTPYLGISYCETEIKRSLINSNYEYTEFDVPQLATLLSNGKIGGVLRGRSEIGPRALGHRSILSAPFSNYAKQTLNQYIKCREPFRPFAPMVTAEEQFTFFDLMQHSPYMLFSAKVKQQFRNSLAAVTHVDATARIQAVDRASEPFIYELLCEMEKKTGFPILLNTSFNGPEEPMVETPLDALSAFHRLNLDFLVLENWLVIKSNYPISRLKNT